MQFVKETLVKNLKLQVDAMGIGLAGLCLIHCLATSIILTVAASTGGILLSPYIHEVGLVLAILLGILALGRGFWVHRSVLPSCVGAVGIGVMAAALSLPHSGLEIIVSMFGVSILAVSHYMNLRASR